MSKDILVTIISGFLWTAVLLAVLILFFIVAFKLIKLLPKAEKAFDIYIEKNAKKEQAQPNEDAPKCD